MEDLDAAGLLGIADIAQQLETPHTERRPHTPSSALTSI